MKAILVAQQKTHRTDHLLVSCNSLSPNPHAMSFIGLGPLQMIFLLSGYYLPYLIHFYLLGFSFNVTSPEKPSLTLHIRIHSLVMHKNRILYFSVAMFAFCARL